MNLTSTGATDVDGSDPRSALPGSTAVATLATAESHHHGSMVDRVDDRAERGIRRLTLVGMGLAGGLVPSPSALVVLLGAIALGRTAFGILLVVGYGVGMAATLITVG